MVGLQKWSLCSLTDRQDPEEAAFKPRKKMNETDRNLKGAGGDHQADATIVEISAKG
jgi:hypothetical protein